MITPAIARDTYRAARAALEDTIFDLQLTESARRTALEGLNTLNVRYIAQQVAEFNALNEQYAGFIRDLQTLLAKLVAPTATPVAGLVKLTDTLAQAQAIFTGGAALVASFGGPVPTGAAGAASPSPKSLRSAGGTGRAARGARAAAEPLRVLCVHGVGGVEESDPAFHSDWRLAVDAAVLKVSAARVVQVEFVAYDHLFAAASLNALDWAGAVFKLGWSGLVNGVGDLFRPRAFGPIADRVRWTAGMVVQWAEHEELRNRACALLQARVEEFQPHAILAHSLGSLIAYDLFARRETRALLADRIFVSFGSQIGNPFVRRTLGGRIEALEAAHWFHLFNRHDDAFAAIIRLRDPRFSQVNTDFNDPGMLDHSAVSYLRHDGARETVWPIIARHGLAVTGAARTLDKSDDKKQLAGPLRVHVRAPKPQRRALLVGINDYPDPADRLEGCVNDVFQMSALLQESGFAAENIRVVLNERATSAGILERLEWLLDGTEDGQERFFYYSGHGAQIPGYGAGEVVDVKDECLVTYDFDWRREHAVTDDQFFELYSQLPPGTRFAAIFDCCHSGGLTKDGGSRVRGISPPDDIRHRALRWDAGHGMWVPRELGDDEEAKGRKACPRFFGEKGDLHRLGSGAELRLPTTKAFEEARKRYDHTGPFMPVIVHACQEDQFSYEYRHGAQSFGAFTYCFSQLVREQRVQGKPISWREAVKAVTRKLHALNYQQTPVLACPRALEKAPIPQPRAGTARRERDPVSG